MKGKMGGRERQQRRRKCQQVGRGVGSRDEEGRRLEPRGGGENMRSIVGERRGSQSRLPDMEGSSCVSSTSGWVWDCVRLPPVVLWDVIGE